MRAQLEQRISLHSRSWLVSVVLLPVPFASGPTVSPLLDALVYILPVGSLSPALSSYFTGAQR